MEWSIPWLVLNLPLNISVAPSWRVKNAPPPLPSEGPSPRPPMVQSYKHWISDSRASRFSAARTTTLWYLFIITMAHFRASIILLLFLLGAIVKLGVAARTNIEVRGTTVAPDYHRMAGKCTEMLTWHDDRLIITASIVVSYWETVAVRTVVVGVVGMEILCKNWRR